MHYNLCVFGNPIEHSKSPQIHKHFAEQFNLSIEYHKIKTELNQFAEAVEEFKNAKGYGFNVTSPFKQKAYRLVAETTQRATSAKSVNTVLIKPDGSLWGDNTDGVGLVTDISKNLNFSLRNKTILILGAGGAARGILPAIVSQFPNKIIIANRTLEKAEQLAKEFRENCQTIGCCFDTLRNNVVDVIINATSFDSHVKLPETLKMTENSLFYDINYGSQQTELMSWAKEKNFSLVKNGIGMLVEQAAEAFYIWTKKQPQTNEILNLL